MEPIFFASPEAFRGWLAENHDREREVLVGYYKKHTGRPTMTWPESVDEALCYGWIDGVRRSAGEEAYTIRFTPRKPRSTWSAVNLQRVPELIAQGRMHPAGLRAYEARDESKSRIYSYENRHSITFDAALEERFRADGAAWAFFQAQPPGYRATCTHWVMSAKQESTRLRRLDQLIADSAAGRRIAQVTRPADRRPRGE